MPVTISNELRDRVEASALHMRIAGRLRNLSVFCCYMPTSSHPDQQDELYLLLMRLMRGCGTDIIITLGDFNAQLGRTPPGQHDTRIGRWGVQKRDNDAGRRMRQFLADSDTAVVNTFFQQKREHLATWRNSSDVENPRLWRQIDYVTISTHWKSCMTGARSYWHPSIRTFKHKFDHAMVKVNFCYRTKCSQVGKSAKRWDLTSLQDEQTVSQFDEKLREQGVVITTMEWKTLATTVTDVAESIIPRESPQRRNQSYLSANTKELILEAKICDSERARLMRRAVYRSKCADYRTYVAECTELT